MPEPVMTDSHSELARSALLEITRAETVGELLGETPEDDGTITVRFASELPGYPGWAWTVSVASVDGEPATVLEAELMPGEGSLLAPEWVPWSERLADYKAAQDALEAEAATGDDADDDESDEDDLDDDDDDPLGNDVLHGGDLDGVDIDDLDEDDLDGDSDELDSDADELDADSDELDGDSDELDSDIDSVLDDTDEGSP